MNFRAISIWAAVACAIAMPLVSATRSPLLEWREPIYIAAGFAGIVGLMLMLVQPLLIGGALLRPLTARRVHMGVGIALVTAVVAHVAGLWITSPPDVIDVLLFRSPTAFGVWGALAMWAVFVAGALAAARRQIDPRVWRLGHTAATVVVVVGTVLHAWLIEGAMGTVSKGVLSLLILGTTSGPYGDDAHGDCSKDEDRRGARTHDRRGALTALDGN